MDLKIVLADDHTIVREGLRSLIDRQVDMKVIAEAATGADAVRLARALAPEVVVMDITMPDMNGIDATRCITEELDGVRVLALSMESDRPFVVEMLKAGASGYLLKDSAFADLVTGIHAVVAGEPYLSPRITEIVIKEYLQRVHDEDLFTGGNLTSREKELLQLIADGKNTKEIAFAFEVSKKTIENQRHQIMKKLDLYSIAHLTKYAIREGLTSMK